MTDQKQYKLREAATVCRTNEIKIRRLILANKLPATKIPQGDKNFIYLVALGDLRRCPQLQVDESLVMAIEKHDEDMESLSSEIAELRQRLEAYAGLERRVERLERELALSEPLERIDTPPAPPTASVSPHRPLQTVILNAPQMSGLPDDLISLNAYAVRHGVNASTAKNAVISGRVRHERGRWRVYAEGKSTVVEYALSHEGRQQFIALFSSLGSFRRCDVPGCECKETGANMRAGSSSNPPGVTA